MNPDSHSAYTARDRTKGCPGNANQATGELSCCGLCRGKSLGGSVSKAAGASEGVMKAERPLKLRKKKQRLILMRIPIEC